MTIIWCMVPEIWSATETIFCHSGPFFALLPPYGPRKSKFWKNEKNTWRYYHFTNKNDSHMMHGSSDMECNEQNFLSFWTAFALLPPNNLKNQNFEKWKKHLEILPFYTCLSCMTILWCMVPEIWSLTDRVFCHFGPFLAFYATNSLKYQNFEKLKKTHGSWDIAHKWFNYCFSFWAISCPFTSLTAWKIKI